MASFAGSWLGKYLASYFGSISNSVYVSAATLSLTSASVVATGYTVAAPPSSSIDAISPVAIAVGGGKLYPSPSYIDILSSGSSVRAGTYASVTGVSAAVSAPSASAFAGAQGLPLASYVSLFSPQHVIRYGAKFIILPSDVATYATNADGRGSTRAPTTVVSTVLTATATIAHAGTDGHAISVILGLTALAPTTRSGAILPVAASHIDALAEPVTAFGSSRIVASYSIATLSATATYANLGYHVAVTGSDVLSVAPAVTTLRTSVAKPTTNILYLVPATASAVGGCLGLTAVQTITLASLPVKAYDYNDAYVRAEPAMVKINIPEVLAFSADVTADMLLVDAIGTDMSVLDGTQSVKLLHKTDNVIIDIASGTAVPENTIYVFQHALIRQIGERDNRAVKQLRQFMQSVQNDDFTTMDTIIEVPVRADVTIRSGDIIETDILGTKYTVIAIDHCTLKTRWRIGARKFV